MVHQIGIITCFLCCFFPILSPVFASGNHPEFPLRHYGSDLGFDASEIYTITTGPKDFLWIGTGNGPYWFDGHQFHQVTVNDGYLSTLCLYAKRIDEEYMLLIGIRPNFLYLIRENQIIRSWSLPSGGEYFHFEPEQGLFSIFGNGSNWNIDLKRGKLVNYQNRRLLDLSGVGPGPTGKPFLRFNNDPFLYHCEGGMLYTVDSLPGNRIFGLEYWGGTLELGKEELENNLVERDTDGQRDGLVGWTDRGIFHLSKSLEVIGQGPGPDGMDYGGIRKSFWDQTGALWFISQKGNLYWYKDGVVSPVRNELLNASCQVNTWYEDRQGNIWVGTEGKGLFCLPNTQFSNYHQFPGLKDEFITSLALGSDNSLFIGTNSGLKTLPGDSSPMPGRGNFSNLPRGLESGYILSIACLADKVYLSRSGYKTKNIFDTFLHSNYRIGNWASFAKSDSQRIAVGKWSTTSILQRTETGWIPEFQVHTRPGYGRVNDMLFEGDSLWLATATGLYIVNLEGNSIEQIDLSRDMERDWRSIDLQDLESQNITPNKNDSKRLPKWKIIDDDITTMGLQPNCYAIEADPKRGMWLGTQNGVYLWNGEDWKALGSLLGKGEHSKGSPYDNQEQMNESPGKCRAIAMDPAGRVWIGTETGLKVFHNSQLHSFNTSNGLAGNQIRALLPDPQRQLLWIGTTTGLSAIPLNIELSDQRSRIKLLSITELHQNIDLPIAPFELPYDQNSLHIVFSALYNTGPNEVQYQYRLLDADSLWHSNSSNEAWLMSLKPGNYRFEVRSKVPGLAWSSPIGVDFIIHSPLWQRPLFQLGVLAFFLIVLSLIFLKRTALIRKRETEKRRYLREIHNLEQQALRASLNPHFVFNALHSVQHFLIKYQDKAGIKFITRLAKLIRLNMDTAQQKAIPLKDEIKRLKLYLDLEKTRLKEKLQYQFDISPVLEDTNPLLPNMILQPIVENAIWHGIAPTGDQGLIIIRLFRENEQLLICEVIDNGVGLGAGTDQSLMTPHTSKGLELIRQRIVLMDKRNTLELMDNSSGRGATARLSIYLL